MSLADSSVYKLLEELAARLDANATILDAPREYSLALRVAAQISEISSARNLVRPLMPDEERAFAESPLIHPTASRFDSTELQLLRYPDERTRRLFHEGLDWVREDEREFKVLSRAVLVENILLPTAATRLLNILLQRGGAYLENQEIDIDAIAGAWDGQIFHLSPSVNGTLVPSLTGLPSELALYGLERKHTVFARLSIELQHVLASLYELEGSTTSIISLTIGARYLLPNAGGTPDHVDAMSAITKVNEGIIANQQFSIFLAARDGEEFIVKNPDGTETSQCSNLSMLSFSPTQNHRHPAGHGSWILVVEALLLTK